MRRTFLLGMKKNIKNKPLKVTETPTKNQTGPIVRNPDGTIVIKIHATPGAKKNTILEIGDEEIRTQINSPPVDGKANDELISFFRDILDVKKSEIFIDKGLKSRNKLLVVNSPKYDAQTLKAKLYASLEK